MNKVIFYILSLTWGSIMTVIGIVTAVILIALGYTPTRHGWCLYFENVGNCNWGGISLGIVCISGTNFDNRLKNHEFGHSIQNIIWGPLFPFVIGLPSLIRAQYRIHKYIKKGIIPPTDYYDIWFERQASDLGDSYIKKIGG